LKQLLTAVVSSRPARPDLLECYVGKTRVIMHGDGPAA